ncbi:MAG TPA: VOC family protein [Candidatus Eremiobacteraceae bacterium]|nr:VOC family protein [Candidatus Eremiobacteraceae bacterium]
MSRPVHFDFPADDPERAVKFYSSAFGWKFDKWSGPFDYWVISTGADSERGIDGGMSPRSAGATSSITISVTSIDDSLKKISDAGGTIVRPKGPIQGVGWFATCKDTEGNEFGVMQSDQSAK